MAAPRFSEWHIVDEGALPEELLPCAYLQYRWSILHSFDLSPYLGISGGQITMEWKVALSVGAGAPTYELESVDTVRFTFVALKDFLLPVCSFYTYWPDRLTTTGPTTGFGEAGYEAPETFGGDQLDFQDWGPQPGLGITEGWMNGLLVSPVYQLELPAGTEVDVSKHFPCAGIGGQGWILEVRTAPGGGAEKLLINDPVSGNRHYFRQYRNIVLCRTWLSGYGNFDGPRLGMTTTAGTGLQAAVSAGTAYVGHQPAELGQGTVVGLTASAINLVWVRTAAIGAEAPPTRLEVVVTTGEEVPSGAPYLIAMVTTSGSTVSAVDLRPVGKVAAFDAESYGGCATEDGRLHIAVDESIAIDVRYESRDGGLTWERQ